jgi:hypothetical protein
MALLLVAGERRSEAAMAEGAAVREEQKRAEHEAAGALSRRRAPSAEPRQ